MNCSAAGPKSTGRPRKTHQRLVIPAAAASLGESPSGPIATFCTAESRSLFVVGPGFMRNKYLRRESVCEPFNDVFDILQTIKSWRSRHMRCQDDVIERK
jgi:hypothetical protein